MQSHILFFSLLLHLTSVLAGPPLQVRQNSDAPTVYGSGGCGPWASLTSSSIPHPCTNEVPLSFSPGYYSGFLSSNPFLHYEGSPASNITDPVLRAETIIPRNWTLQCDVEKICSKLDAAVQPNSHPLNSWVWDHSSPNCLMGFYIPAVAEVVNAKGRTVTVTPQPPTKNDCMKRTIGPLLRLITYEITRTQGGPLGNRYPNRASINLPLVGWPDFVAEVNLTLADVNNDRGSAMVAGWPRWFVQAWPSSSD